MRSLFRLTAASLLVAVAACSDGTEPELDASLQRDLRLASTTSFTLPPSGNEELLLETAPSAVEEPKVAPRRAPSGNVATMPRTAPNAVCTSTCSRGNTCRASV